MAEQVTYSRVYVFKGDPVRVERAIPQKLGPRKAGKPNPSLIFFNLPPECTELDVILYCKSIVPQICREVRFVVQGPKTMCFIDTLTTEDATAIIAGSRGLVWHGRRIQVDYNTQGGVDPNKQPLQPLLEKPRYETPRPQLRNQRAIDQRELDWDRRAIEAPIKPIVKPFFSKRRIGRPGGVYNMDSGELRPGPALRNAEEYLERAWREVNQPVESNGSKAKPVEPSKEPAWVKMAKAGDIAEPSKEPAWMKMAKCGDIAEPVENLKVFVPKPPSPNSPPASPKIINHQLPKAPKVVKSFARSLVAPEPSTLPIPSKFAHIVEETHDDKILESGDEVMVGKSPGFVMDVLGPDAIQVWLTDKNFAHVYKRSEVVWLLTPDSLK